MRDACMRSGRGSVGWSIRPVCRRLKRSGRHACGSGVLSMAALARVKGAPRQKGMRDDVVRLLCGQSRNCPGQLGTVDVEFVGRTATAFFTLMLNASYVAVLLEPDVWAWASSRWAAKRGLLVPRRPR